MTAIVRCDRLGRIKLDRELRKKYGNTFFVSEDDRGILLLRVKNSPHEYYLRKREQEKNKI